MHVFQAESMSVEWPGASSWNYKEIAQAVPSYKLMTMSVECSNSSKCLHHDQTANMLSFVKCACSIDHKIPKYEMLKKRVWTHYGTTSTLPKLTWEASDNYE